MADCDAPKLPPFIELHTTDCLPDPPEGFQPFEPDCIDDEDIDQTKIASGGRSMIVVPYDTDVCSGQRGKFQALSGYGGQICDAIYLGNTVGRRSDPSILEKLPDHQIGVCQDEEFTGEPDCLLKDPDVDGGPKGDKGLAVRDKGQWYVVRLGGEPEEAVNTAIVMGGNIPVPPDEIPVSVALTPNVCQAMPMNNEWDIADVDVEELGKELKKNDADPENPGSPQQGYYTDDTTDPLEDHGLRPGVGVAWRYDPSLSGSAKELVYIINRIPGLALMQGQPVFLISQYNVPLLEESGDPVLDDNDLPVTAVVYEAVG